jgi:hypothetical protein
MTYKQWILATTQECNGFVVDYIDQEGNQYNELFCFATLDEAYNSGQVCIDRIIQSQSKSFT